MNEIATEKTMTVKEVAEALGVSVETVTAKIRELYPDKMQQGKTTYLNEIEVTNIKINSVKKYEATTDLEMLLLSKKVDQWKDAKINALQKENDELKPKAIQYDAFLNNDSNQRIGDVAKLFGLKPHKLFKMLRDAKILKDNYVPYEPYEHHFKTVETPTAGGFNVFTSYIKPSGVDYISRRFNLQRTA